MRHLPYESQFLIALLLTCAIEVFVVLGIRAWCKRSEAFARLFSPLHNHGTIRVIIGTAMASTMTLPYLWFVLPSFELNRLAFLLVGELSVVFAEAAFYVVAFQMRPRGAFVLSLLANLASFLCSYIV